MKLLLLISIFFKLAVASTYIDLGKAGNNFGYNNYLSYLKKDNHCLSSGANNPRVIITGFGKWEKNKLNISSSVLDEVAQEVISLRQESFFGEILNKTILIDTKPVDICFVKLAVAWDISSAILISEADSFKPDLVIMMGDGVSGKLMIETKARNATAKFSGFNHNGDDLGKLSTPKGLFAITGRIRDPRFMEMNWDYFKIKKELSLMSEEFQSTFDIQLNTKHIKSNIYICNALSYTFLRAIDNKKIALFKKKLKLYPKFEKDIKTGFLHLPSLKAKEQTIEQFDLLSKMVKKVISINL